MGPEHILDESTHVEADQFKPKTEGSGFLKPGKVAAETYNPRRTLFYKISGLVIGVGLGVLSPLAFGINLDDSKFLLTASVTVPTAAILSAITFSLLEMRHNPRL